MYKGMGNVRKRNTNRVKMLRSKERIYNLRGIRSSDMRLFVASVKREGGVWKMANKENVAAWMSKKVVNSMIKNYENEKLPKCCFFLHQPKYPRKKLEQSGEQ